MHGAGGCSSLAAANTADSGSEATQAASEQPNGGQAEEQASSEASGTEEDGGDAGAQGGTAPDRAFGGTGIEDPDAPDDAADLTGIVTAVQDGVPAITTIGGGAMPGGGMQPPGDGEEFQPPAGGEGFTPPNDGERPDMPSGENMPQGEETEVSLSENTVMKKGEYSMQVSSVSQSYLSSLYANLLSKATEQADTATETANTSSGELLFSGGDADYVMQTMLENIMSKLSSGSDEETQAQTQTETEKAAAAYGQNMIMV